MKRTYVKPVMESEEFVANEYVAACWKVTCDTFLDPNHYICRNKSEIVRADNEKDIGEDFASGNKFPNTNVIAFQGGRWYNGTIGGNETWHHVSIEEATNSNAS